MNLEESFGFQFTVKDFGGQGWFRILGLDFGRVTSGAKP